MVAEKINSRGQRNETRRRATSTQYKLRKTHIRIHVLYNTVRVLPVTRQVGSSALTEILDELYLDDEFEAFRFDLQHLELDDFGYGSAKSAILVLVRLVPRCVAQTRG